MEKLAEKIGNILEETLSSYKELQRVLELEKGYIIEMSIDSMWETIARKKQIALKLGKLKEKIQPLFGKRAIEVHMDTENFKLPDFIKKMPDSEVVKSNLRKIGLALETCKQNVENLAAANKKYIDEHLSVINEIFSLFADTSRKKQYNNAGNLLETKEKNRLINAEA